MSCCQLCMCDQRHIRSAAPRAAHAPHTAHLPATVPHSLFFFPHLSLSSVMSSSGCHESESHDIQFIWCNACELHVCVHVLQVRPWRREHLRRGLLMPSHLQFRPMLERLNAGEPVNVFALGSSITQDFAGELWMCVA